MPIDFDVKTFLEHIQGLKPPYECPVKECGKVYKSLTGMQNHIYSYDHDNPENNTPSKKPGSIRKKPGHWRKGGVNGGGASPGPEIWKKSTRDPLTYAEAQRVVEVDLDGEIHRINIYDPLEVISQDQIDNCDNTEKEEMLQKAALKGGKGGKGKDVAKGKQKKEPGPNSTANGPKLPEASFKILDDYVRPQRAPVRSETYFRFIEKTTEVLDEEVEYDMDEEDHAWLQLINEQRRKDNLSVVTQENFEMLMDRFEKEAFFQSQSAGKDSGPPIDDDAVCAICMDGECQNSNVILFCDMCNLAVHQECYGVPYIPEGQWLCRRCLHSPSRAVDCCLCPNKGGAFKQTDDGRWAHVVCALWIPEVGFSNTVFLEPIDSIASIPPARWKLTCYICKQRGSSACIQCHKSNCYTAFHVTCAQQAGLFMKIEPVRESSVHGATINVRKTAFCDSHTPPNMDFHPMIDNGVSDNEENKPKSMTPGEIKAKSRNVMRKARKILAEKRNAVPVVSIPTISPRKMDKIASTVSLTKKNQFLGRLQSYWTLKRQSRNGVPLLRRLQSSHMSRNREQSQTDSESQALREQLKYWQRLRQDLERARLLVELIRKREKLKREQLRLQQLATEMKLTPFLMLLRHTLDQLDEVDSTSLFAEPVDTNEVDDYLTVISEPMDLRTMRVKIENHEYSRIEQFEAHFDLMVSNCLRYNNRDTPFYKQGIRMRDQGGAVLRAARRMAERVGYDPETGLHLAEPPADVPPLPVADEDNFLAGARREGMPLEEQLRALLDRLDILNATRPKRNKLATQIKREVVKVRRQLALQKGERLLSEEEDANRSALDTPAESEPEEEQEEGRARNSTPAPDTNLSSPARSGRGRGRGRGRPRGRPPARARRTSLQDTDTSMAAGDASEEGDEDGSSSRAPSPHPVEDTPASPVSRGPGRRASGYRQSRRSSQDSVVEEEGARDGTEERAASVGSEATDATGRASRSAAQSTDMETSVKDATPVVEVKKRQSHRGTPSIKRRSAGPAAEGGESKRSRGVAAAAGDGGAAGSPIPRNKDSFRTYRQLSGAFESELEETSDNSSTEESISTSDTGDSSDSDADDDTGVSPGCETSLEPLDLVWAKCRGYPWYPALIINPKMPKTGYFHNGVPIPVPPDDVLQLQNKYDEPVFLVLFFDTKRTWQWLPSGKLEPLGVDSCRDKGKLLDNKKPNVRKSVRRAYEKAIIHRCRVTGEPNPLLTEVADLDTDAQ